MTVPAGTPSADSLTSGSAESEAIASDSDRTTQIRIRIRIPKTYHGEPVISRLVSDYELTVNIKAALLGANAREDGWFDLELTGHESQIQSALTYLNELDLEIWHDSDEGDGW